MIGRFIAVVGPSGVGKDSVMNALVAARPDLVRGRRVITRTEDAGGERFDSVSEAEFSLRVARGAFAVHWQAHGFSYGIPASVDRHLSEGSDVLANMSRAVLRKAARRFPEFLVLSLTAKSEVLQQRLTARGRESADQIDARLQRAGQPLSDGLPVIALDNSGPLADTVAAALAALYPAKV